MALRSYSTARLAVAFCCLVALSSGEAEPVVLALKWHHQFQFAGYYAAIDQGYYASEGLNVSLTVPSAGIYPVQAVLSGAAQYGIGSSDLVRERAAGRPVVAVVPIFQHSPIILMARQDGRRRYLADFLDATIMSSPDDRAEIQAMFAREHLPVERLRFIDHTWSVEPLVRGEVDATIDYLTNEPWLLRQRGVEPLILRPVDYGIDFYGDTLFTSGEEAQNRPQRVEAMRRATIRGWEYALAHPEEVIERILAMPGVREQGKTREHLRYEATCISELTQVKLVPVGQVNPARWQRMADIYAERGVLLAGTSLDGFVWSPLQRGALPRWLPWAGGSLGLALFGAAAYLLWMRAERWRYQLALSRADADLRRREKEWRLVVDHVDLIFFHLDADGRFLMSEGHGLAALGLRPGQVVGLDARTFYAGNPEIVANLDRAFMGSSVTGEARVGNEIFETMFVPVRHDGIVDGVLGVAHRVTQRVHAEHELREREERLRVTLRSIGDAVIATDTAGLVVDLNPVAEQLTGWKIAEAAGRPLDEVFRIVNAHTRATVESPARQVLASGRIVGLANHTVLIARDGSEHHIADSGAPICGEDGRMRGVVLVFRDVTEEMHARERAQHDERLRGLGQLAGGIAHDFNNILTAILGSAGLLESHLPREDERGRQLARTIATAGARAAGITRQLLAYARRQQMTAEALDMHQLVHETLAMLRLSLDPRINVELDLAAGDARIAGDPAQLQTALMNLCLNAAHAMPDGGRLRISTRRIGSERFELAVADSGSGIPPEQLPRIFEPFFTTKDPGKGSGLGLPSALGTAQQHGGTIEVESRVGVGTVMRIILPIATAQIVTAPTSTASPLASPMLGRGRILVAEDEPIIRDLACEILIAIGYQAVAVADGAQAADLLRTEPDGFDAAVIDMRMPVMGGRGCFLALRAIRPDLPVIIASGYHEDQLDDLLASGLAGMLAKPYDSTSLGKAVAAALAGRSERTGDRTAS